MTSHDITVADRGQRRAAFIIGVGACLAWSVPVMVALSGPQPVRVDAVVAWVGLIGVGFLVGVSFSGSLPSRLRRGDATAPRPRAARRSDTVVAMFLLAASVSLTAQDAWGHWYSLFQVGAAIAAGLELAAATGPTDLGRRGSHWHPEMIE